MSSQSMLVISILLFLLILWIINSFIKRRLSSGQSLFWIILLLGAEILTIFPGLVDKLSFLWGDLLPVSWISFISTVCLISYLLYQSVKINAQKIKFIDMVREISFLEERIRKLESKADKVR